jgi:hypothetical protein
MESAAKKILFFMFEACFGCKDTNFSPVGKIIFENKFNAM